MANDWKNAGKIWNLGCVFEEEYINWITGAILFPRGFFVVETARFRLKRNKMEEGLHECQIDTDTETSSA